MHVCSMRVYVTSTHLNCFMLRPADVTSYLKHTPVIILCL